MEEEGDKWRSGPFLLVDAIIFELVAIPRERRWFIFRNESDDAVFGRHVRRPRRDVHARTRDEIFSPSLLAAIETTWISAVPRDPY